MQAWGGGRNTLAYEVSLPVTESSSGNREITAGCDRADAWYIRALGDEKPRELSPATTLPRLAAACRKCFNSLCWRALT
jgi:hypothetical protein